MFDLRELFYRLVKTFSLSKSDVLTDHLLDVLGLCAEAIEEHEEEIYFSEASGDVIGVAVGHRKVGECLCGLEKFSEALHHQRKHLKVNP